MMKITILKKKSTKIAGAILVLLVMIIVIYSIKYRAVEQVLPKPVVSNSTIQIIVNEDNNSQIVPGEGTLTIGGSVRSITNQPAKNGLLTEPFVGGHVFILDSSVVGPSGAQPIQINPKPYQVTSLSYKSFLTNKLYILPPTGVPNSLSALELTGQAVVTITIDRNGNPSMTVKQDTPPSLLQTPSQP